MELNGRFYLLSWWPDWFILLCLVMLGSGPSVEAQEPVGAAAQACPAVAMVSACVRGAAEAPDDYVKVERAGLRELGLRLENYNNIYFKNRRKADRNFCPHGICYPERCDGDEMEAAKARHALLKESFESNGGALCREDVLRFNRQLFQYVGMDSPEVLSFREYLTPLRQRELEQSGDKLMFWTEGVLGAWLLSEARDPLAYTISGNEARTYPQEKWEQVRGLASRTEEAGSRQRSPFKGRWNLEGGSTRSESSGKGGGGKIAR